MQLDTSMEGLYIPKDFQSVNSLGHNRDTKLKNGNTPGSSDIYPYPNAPSSEIGDYHHAITTDFWYTQNTDIVTKRELQNIHNSSFTDYPIYEDVKNSVIPPTSNTGIGYLLPLTGTRYESIDSRVESSPKKGLLKNLKAAFFTKKNAKRSKAKQMLHLPVINLSREHSRPVFYQAPNVNNLRSAYSMDCLNVIENTIMWRELSNTKSLTVKNKNSDSACSNNRVRHSSGSDILADVLRNNTINDSLTREKLTQNAKIQSEKPKAIIQNGHSVFRHAQRDVDNMSESQSEIFFGEENSDSEHDDQKFSSHYTKRQNQKIVPKYYKQNGPITNRYPENTGSNTTLSKLKNSISSSTSSTKSSASSGQMQDERNLSLSSLTLSNSKAQQELLDRHFHTISSNHPPNRYLQPQTKRWGQENTDFNHGLSESGVSIESSDSGLGSYSGSYVAKVKRTVHFNGSDEVFEYIPVNSGNHKQRLRNGTVVAKNHGRRTKIATYL